MTITTDHWEITQCHRWDGTPMKILLYRDYHRKSDWTEASKMEVAGRIAAEWAASTADLADFTDLGGSYFEKVMVQPFGRSDLSDAVRVIVQVELKAETTDRTTFTERDWNEEA
jgi:hypothetical protein